MNFDELDKMGCEPEQVFDLHLERWRTARKTGPNGSIFVKDGNEVGTWLERGEYSKTGSLEALGCDNCHHPASQHFSKRHGYAACKEGGCRCLWFSTDMQTWESAR